MGSQLIWWGALVWGWKVGWSGYRGGREEKKREGGREVEVSRRKGGGAEGEREESIQ